MNIKVPFAIIFLLLTQTFFAQESKNETVSSESSTAATTAPIDFKKQMQDLKDQEKAYLAKIEAEKKAVAEAKIAEEKAAKAKAEADKKAAEQAKIAAAKEAAIAAKVKAEAEAKGAAEAKEAARVAAIEAKAKEEAEEKARKEAEANQPKKKSGGLGFLLAGLGIVAAVVTFGATRKD